MEKILIQTREEDREEQTLAAEDRGAEKKIRGEVDDSLLNCC